MTTLIVGPGALGQLIAFAFARAGVESLLLDHRLERASQLASGGIAVDWGDGIWSGATEVEVTADLLSIDWARVSGAILTVKAGQLETVLDTLAPSLPSRTPILIMSNGINLEQLFPRYPQLDIERASVEYGIYPQEMGRLVTSRDGRIRLARNSSWIPTLRAVDLTVEPEQDMESVIWHKGCLNCAVNPLSALLRVQNGSLSNSPPFELLVEVALECAAVARIVLEESKSSLETRRSCWERDDWESELSQLLIRTRHNYSSMYVDLQRGRTTEVDFLNGEVCRLGERYQIATPLNHCLLTLIKCLETQSK